MATLVIGAAVLLGFYMAWTIGANDVANSMGDAVGSRAIRVRTAIILAAIFELSGAMLLGSHVTDTIRKGIVTPEAMVGRPEVLVLGMACALLAAAAWLHLATWMGMPVSTTHSIVGGVAGFGIIAAGWGSIQWGRMGEIVASWVISPVAGAVLAFALFKLISFLVLGRAQPARAALRAGPYFVFLTVLVVMLSTTCGGMEREITKRLPWFTLRVAALVSACTAVAAAAVARILLGRYLGGKHGLPLAEQIRFVERIFAPLVVITSCSVAFAHGANDVANAVGPLAAILDILRSGTVKMRVAVPMWVLGIGGVGIVVGLSTYGYKVMRTIGSKITQLTPTRGVAADIATVTTVLVCTRMKLPISTTHTIVGAIVGIGLARGLWAVDRRVMGNVLSAWFVTVPAAVVLAIVFFLIGRPLVLDAIAQVVRAAAGAGPA